MLSEAAYYSLRTISRNNSTFDVLDALADIARENALDHKDADFPAIAAKYDAIEKTFRAVSKFDHVVNG